MTTQTVTTETKSAEGRRNAPETKLVPSIHPLGAKPVYGNQALLRMRTLPAPALQRECACGGSGESGGECAECKEKHEGTLPRVAAQPFSANAVPPIVRRVLHSPGRPLDVATRAFMEGRFGQDFSRVRLHTDAQGAESARAVGALAYTVGRNVVFGSRRYTPETRDGRHLLAHELTHTIQQSSGTGTPTVQAKLRVGDAADQYEREADRVADGVMRMTDRAAPVLQRQSPPQPEPPPEQPAPATEQAGPPSPGSPATSPAAPGATAPACAAVPPSTPGTCPVRHDGYCGAAKCFPANRWLPCACSVSTGICDAVDAFHLDVTTARGAGLMACLAVPPASLASIPLTRAKGDWFLNTNRCIWGHWRAAFDALNDPSRAIPPGLTPEWAAAVGTCRSAGLGSADCCRAHVVAEQNAIDRCGPYDSSRFGKSPTDVPGAPACSLAASVIAPGPAFTGDFGVVADRIKYGNAVCCP